MKKRLWLSWGLLASLSLLGLLYLSYHWYVTRPWQWPHRSQQGLLTPQAINQPERKLIRILAIDGGGIRGIIPLHVLNYFERQSGKPISQLFDIMIGTSTGAIMVAALATPDTQGKPRYSAQALLDVYDQSSEFDNPWYHRLLTLNGIIGPQFTGATVHKEYIQVFGANLNFYQLLNHVIVPAYALEKHEVVFFNNWEPQQSNFKVVDVLTGATAAPRFLPPILVSNLNHTLAFTLIDGAVAINNPAMQGLIEAIKVYPDKQYLIVSLGTGLNLPTFDPKAARDWGAWGWLNNIFSIMSIGASEVSDEQLQVLHRAEPQLLPYYMRFNIVVDKAHQRFFDVSSDNLAALNHYGEVLVTQNQVQLNQLSTLLAANAS